MSAHRDVPDAVVSRLDLICRALPEARQEEAWTGIRWRVGAKTFAHVVAIDRGWPPACAARPPAPAARRSGFVGLRRAARRRRWPFVSRR